MISHNYKGELIFVRLLFPLVLGITAGTVLPTLVFIYHLTLLLSILSLIFVWCSTYFYKRYKIYLSRWKPGLAVNLLVFFAGVALAISKDPRISKSHFSKYTDQGLVLVVNSEPKQNKGILRFEGKAEQGLVNRKFQCREGGLLVALKQGDSPSTLRYGDKILIPAAFTEVEPPYNPYEFDYRAFLANRGIYHQIFADESEIRVLSRAADNSIIGFSQALRRSLVLKYSKYIHNDEAAAVASTLILGYKAELSREVLSAYSKTGTMHVLSVSGMHVGLVFYILNALLWFMGRNKALRILRAVIIISLIWFYAVITGFSPSVCRAAVMLSIYVLGKAIYRNTNSYNLVAVSAVFLLVYNPIFLFDVGFQLSYLAVLGLIYFYPKIYHLLYIKNGLGDKIWSYTALSCAAQLATFPLGMYYFHQFPVYFLVSNLFIVLPVIVTMYLGIAFLFIPWNNVLKPLGQCLERGIIFMDEGLYRIEKLPFATVSAYNGLPYYLILYLLIVLLVWSLQYRNKRTLYAAFACVFLLVSYHSFSSILLLNQRNITFYSLRKNTAFSFFSSGQANVFSDLDSAHKTISFSVHAAIESKSDEMRYHYLKDAVGSKPISSNGRFFQFGNWRMLLWDKTLDRYSFSHRLSVDALLLSGKPKVKLKELVKNVNFKLLLIDATNPDYLIKQWSEEASALSLNYYVLKKKPAYSLTLN